MPTALISVYKKEGIIDFARQLIGIGWDILASGGTAKALAGADIPVKDISSLVGGGPILGHRVVTLSREIHAGLLARNTEEDLEELKGLKIPWIDLVCVDLYPLEEEINKAGSTPESVIEMTDIGGPTMLRSAAKGGRIVICDPADRQFVIDWLKAGRPDEGFFINALAAKAENTVAKYCLASACYRGAGDYDGISGKKFSVCKYGENAPQTPAAFYSCGIRDYLALDKFKPVAGDALSFINYTDLDRLLQTITHIAAAFDSNGRRVPQIAVAVKHGNACGAAVGQNPVVVLQKMIKGNPEAIFGGLVITNFSITELYAETLLTYMKPAGELRLFDGIFAPEFTEGSIKMLQRKKDRCRLLTNPVLHSLNVLSLDLARRVRPVRGGFLAQPNYTFVLDLEDNRIAKFRQPSETQKDDLLLAWAIGSTSNSNTIVLVKEGYLLGRGVNQASRVAACKLAVDQAKEAGHRISGAVAYSDSFFPFDDGPKVLIEAGVTAIFSSSGSVRDADTIELCEKNGTALWLIPDSVGRGFFGH